MRSWVGIQLLALCLIEALLSSTSTEIVATSRWPAVPAGTIRLKSRAQTLFHHTLSGDNPQQEVQLVCRGQEVTGTFVPNKSGYQAAHTPLYTSCRHSLWWDQLLTWITIHTDRIRVADWSALWHDQTSFSLLHSTFQPSHPSPVQGSDRHSGSGWLRHAQM